MPRWIICGKCDGKGKVGNIVCWLCRGKGKLYSEEKK